MSCQSKTSSPGRSSEFVVIVALAVVREAAGHNLRRGHGHAEQTGVELRRIQRKAAPKVVPDQFQSGNPVYLSPGAPGLAPLLLLLHIAVARPLVRTKAFEMRWQVV